MLGRRDARVHNDVSWSSARAGRGIHHLEDGGGGGVVGGGGGEIRQTRGCHMSRTSMKGILSVGKVGLYPWQNELRMISPGDTPR